MWKIAIIDDDRQVLAGMKKAIPWDDLHAVWIGEGMDGKEGLEMILATEPDIVITDIYMPVMNGLELIERLRLLGYKGKILIHSGYTDFEYARQALRLNVEDYITKPISMATLCEVLQRTIRSLEANISVEREREEMRSKLVMYEPFVSREWMKAVLTGTWEEWTEHAAVFSRFTDNADRDRHVVMVIETYRTSRTANSNLFDRRLYRFAVGNIVSETVRQQGLDFDYADLFGNQSAVVLHWRSGTSNAEVAQAVRELAEGMTQNVGKYLKTSVKIGIGGLKEGWTNVSESTEEAYQALSRKTIVSHEEPNGIKPVKFYHRLAEAIRDSQLKQARGVIGEFAGVLEEHPAVSPAYLQKLGKDLWAILLYALSDVGIDLEPIYEDAAVRSELDAIQTPSQFQEWLYRKAEGICSNKQWDENLKHKQAVEFMTQYIHEHYAEEISLSDLAEKVYISRNYLSSIFRNATGETFNNYMTRVRMERAKSLILEGKLMVYEIAEKVGYRNVPYFSTLFRKQFGMRPSDLVR